MSGPDLRLIAPWRRLCTVVPPFDDAEPDRGRTRPPFARRSESSPNQAPFSETAPARQLQAGAGRCRCSATESPAFRRRSRNNRTTSLLLVALAPLAALIACGRHDAPPPPAGQTTAPRAVETVVLTANSPSPGSAPATVSARQRAALAARIPAAVRELPFEEGDAVRAGQVVARLDDDALRSALAAAQAEARAAEADHARFARLLERQAATPREAEAAESRAAAARAAVAASRDAIAYAVLRAPFDGRLARRLVSQGDVVAPGQALVEVESAATFELRASLDSAAAAALASGERLQAEVDGSAEPLAVTVRAVSRAGDPGTHRFEVVADFDAPPATLRSGAYARLLLPAGAGEPPGGAALSIPVAATLERGGLTGVFVADQGMARLRWIAPGERRGDQLAVRAGLEPGERVILEPAGLYDGAPIAEEPR